MDDKLSTNRNQYCSLLAVWLVFSLMLEAKISEINKKRILLSYTHGSAKPIFLKAIVMNAVSQNKSLTIPNKII